MRPWGDATGELRASAKTRDRVKSGTLKMEAKKDCIINGDEFSFWIASPLM